MFLRHPTRLLSAHIDGELDPQTDSRVASHLDQCDSCRRLHARIAAGARWAGLLPPAPAPDGLLLEIERRISESEAAPKPPRRVTSPTRWALATAAVLLVTLLWTLVPRRPSRNEDGLELRSYFASVALARPETLTAAIEAAPPGFETGPKKQTLREAGIELAPPLEHFELVEQRRRETPQAVATELVYAANGEAFSVFVAPALLPVRPSARELAESQIAGALCHRLEPSRATVVWFSGGQFQCVLISAFDDPRRIASIIDYFRAAHEAEARRGTS